MTTGRWRSTTALVVWVTLMTACATALMRAADEESGVQPPPVNSQPQRVIVLFSGRVILGDVVERPGGYLVRERYGSVVVPFTQVLLTAADLPDAYRKLSGRLKAPTAAQHLDLAEWCFDNRLYGSAQSEVKRALMLEPERRDARDFLRKLQRAVESGEDHDRPSLLSGISGTLVDPDHPGQAWKSYARLKRVEAHSDEPSSIGGLSTDTVQMFVRQVQPLLMNKCGNARCHGQAATNEFRLTPVRRGMSGFRILTEKNVSAALREIDSQSPRESPLLSVTTGRHAGIEELFAGPSADRQRQILIEWVFRAAGEIAKHEVADSSSAVPQRDDPLIRDSAVTRDPFLVQILAEERPDRFDPAVFNEMMHSQ